MTYKSAKGVFDILPKDPDPDNQWRCSHLWQYVESTARKLSSYYGFREIRTPLFESTELFERGVGQGTDIVSKEMYTFQDRAGRSLSLRPEGTAPAMRAFIEKGLFNQGPIHKFFYLNSMFRYERSQSGRYRQHHQFGAEALGSPSPFQDAELIDLFYTFLQTLGLKGLTLHLNSIGSRETREAFKNELKKYLLPHLASLSAESQERFHSNALRILDSKNLTDKEILKEAPSILEFLDPLSKEHFEETCKQLTNAQIPFTINPLLVRGLDYYNRTVFEVTANELGAQNSLGGGGRYDGLVQELGGPDTAACGFGAGLERILQTCLAQGVHLPDFPRSTLFLIPLGEEAMQTCFAFLCRLRKKEIAAEMDFSGKKLKNAMRYADQIKARFVAVIGEKEIESRKIELKEMDTGKVEVVDFDTLEKRLTAHSNPPEK